MSENVYFEDKVITFTSDYPSTDGDGTLVLPAEGLTIAKVLQNFGISKSLAIVSPAYARLFGEFSAFFRTVEAAGGVVRDRNGRTLVILRDGRWDLPKGHRERGESSRECAVREVEEECGITGVLCGGLLTITRHAYEHQGEWTLKTCNWYAMTYNGSETPSPERGEGIEKAEWMGAQELRGAMRTSYLTIRSVLDLA